MTRLLILILAILSLGGAVLAEVRIKDLVEFDGVRGNDLVGYGLVVGLNGTGDGIRNAPFIPTVIDQNPCAHLRMPRDMIFHGWSMRLFQAWQHSATMSS